MFIKIFLFACTVFVSVQCESSSKDEFGSFWGPCSASPLNASSTVYYNDILGKWYIHRVLGQYSPWKYFECQSNTIRSNWKNNNFNVTSRFDLPGIQLPIVWDGVVNTVPTEKGEFNFDYVLDKSWYLSQTTKFIQMYRYQGAALAWTCLDFGIFHIESIAVMTKYQDPNDSRIEKSIFYNMNKTLGYAGISPEWFQPIPQFNCDYGSSSSSSSSFLSSSFSAIKDLRSAVSGALLKGLYKTLIGFM